MFARISSILFTPSYLRPLLPQKPRHFGNWPIHSTHQELPPIQKKVDPSPDTQEALKTDDAVQKHFQNKKSHPEPQREIPLKEQTIDDIFHGVT